MIKIKNFRFRAVILIFAFCILHSNGYAEIESDEELRLYLGEVKIISVNNPTRIAIGNPNIADVASVSRSEITLSPKAAGSTTLVFWDNFGEQSYRIKVFSEDMNEIKRRVDNLLQKLNLPQVYTQAEEEEGKVLVLGRVKSAQERERMLTALGALKDKIADLLEIKEEEAVVEIDVQILELNKDATRTLGFTMPGSISVSEPSTRFSKTMRGTMDALVHVFDWPRNEFTATVEALAQEGKARILSRPRLACQSGKEAELLVGGEKPIFTTSVLSTAGTSSTEVDYKEYGIKLKIKPTVTDGKQIKLALNVEVSEVGDAEIIGSAAAPTAKAYPLTKRTASTELFLNDGQTMAIGGLIKQKTEEDIRKTPGLGDIPVLGLFFRKKTTKTGGGQGQRGDSELFITLTPTIITPKEAKEAKGEIRTKITPSFIKEDFSDDPIAGYANIIQKRILENLFYPVSARQAGFKGTVKLSLRLSYRGELLETKIKDSSGYKILDDNAIATAKGIVSYPPFPSAIEQKELWIDIPIAYQLD